MGKKNEVSPNKKEVDTQEDQGAVANTEEKTVDTQEDQGDKSSTAKKTAENSSILEKAKGELEMMKNLSVSKLWKNSGGEYFTSDNLALLSEKGNEENVTPINKTDLETIIKSLS